MVRATSLRQRLVANPYELLLAVILIVSSLSYLLGAVPSQAIDATLPWSMRLLWNAEEFAGGVLTAVGVLFRAPRPFVLGLYLMAGGTFVYGVALVGFVHILTVPVVVSAAFNFGFTLACLVRAHREGALWIHR